MRGRATNFVRYPIVSSMGVRGVAIALKSLQVIALVRLYGAEAFGVFSVAVGVFTLAMVLGRFGLDHYLLREANRRDQRSYRYVVKISLGIAIPSLVSAALAFCVIKMFYSSDVVNAFTFFVVAAPIYAVMWNQLFILRGAGWVNISLVIFEIVNPIFLLGFAYILRDAAQGLALSFLFSATATAAMTYIAVVRLQQGEFTRCASFVEMRSAVLSSRSFFSLSIMEAIQSLADSLAVGFFLRPVDAAVYAIVTRVAGLVLLPIAITTIYMNNTVARLRSEQLSTILSALRLPVFVNISISGFVSIGALLALPFVEKIFDVEFGADAQSSYLMVVAAQFVSGSTAFVRSILFMSGREAFISRTLAFLIVPYVLALIMFTSEYGLLLVGGAFLCFTLTRQIILSLFLAVSLRRERC